MKNVMFGMLMVLLLVPVPAWAHEHGGPEQGPEGGFDASFMIGTVLMAGRPAQDEVGQDNELITGYSRKADRETSVKPMLIADIGYTFASTGTRIFLKNRPEEETIASALAGVKQPFGRAGALTLSLGFTRKDVWEDPYLLGVDREKTSEDDADLNLVYEGIMGTGALVEYSGRAVRVGHDRAGDSDRYLCRDGSAHSLGLGYVFLPREGHSLKSRAACLRGDFGGKSNSYDGYELALSYAFMKHPFAVEASLKYDREEYDRIHPVFSRTRDQETLSGILMLTFMEPLGFRNTSFTVLACYERSDSNISFFDSQNAVGGMAAGYRF